MDLDLTKLIAFSLDVESDTGAMGKSPSEIRALWERYQNFVDLVDLWNDVPPLVAAKLRNYELVWASHIRGLSAAAPGAAPATFKTPSSEQSVKSESVSTNVKTEGQE